MTTSSFYNRAMHTEASLTGACAVTRSHYCFFFFVGIGLTGVLASENRGASAAFGVGAKASPLLCDDAGDGRSSPTCETFLPTFDDDADGLHLLQRQATLTKRKKRARKEETLPASSLVATGKP